MINAWELVAAVQDRFRGLPTKMAAMNGKTKEWYSSHSREPKTQNPLSSGNVSEVEHFMRYARKCEGGIRGAGKYLVSLVHGELQAEFAGTDLTDVCQIELELEVAEEVSDVTKWFIRYDIDHAKRSDLMSFQDHCNEAIAVIESAKARARARQRAIEIGRD